MTCFRLRCYVNNSFLVFHQGTKHSKTIKHSRFALVFHTVFSCLDPLMKHSNSLFTYNILIKENARVMLTTNVDISDRLINGQLGTVTKVFVDNVSNKPSTIFVKFDDSNAGISAIRNSSSSFARENNLVPIKPVLARIKVRPGKPSSPEMQRLQFPVTLAWACTVHKVQGLTLDNIVVSFDLKSKGILTMVRYM